MSHPTCLAAALVAGVAFLAWTPAAAQSLDGHTLTADGLAPEVVTALVGSDAVTGGVGGSGASVAAAGSADRRSRSRLAGARSSWDNPRLR